jgi:hypothetical protein
MNRYTYTVERAVESAAELHNLIRWPIVMANLADDRTPRVIGQYPTRLAAIESCLSYAGDSQGSVENRRDGAS